MVWGPSLVQKDSCSWEGKPSARRQRLCSCAALSFSSLTISPARSTWRRSVDSGSASLDEAMRCAWSSHIGGVPYAVRPTSSSSRRARSKRKARLTISWADATRHASSGRGSPRSRTLALGQRPYREEDVPIRTTIRPHIEQVSGTAIFPRYATSPRFRHSCCMWSRRLRGVGNRRSLARYDDHLRQDSYCPERHRYGVKRT